MNKRIINKSRVFAVFVVAILIILLAFNNEAYADLVDIPANLVDSPLQRVDIDSVEKETTSGKESSSLQTSEKLEASRSDTFKYIIAASGGLLLLIVVLVTRPHSKNEEIIAEAAIGSKVNSNNNDSDI